MNQPSKTSSDFVKATGLPDTSSTVAQPFVFDNDPLNEVVNRDPLMQFFAFDHLPDHLRVVSKPFAQLANDLVLHIPRNPERTVALRKLLEAKDCAVRAVIYK